MQNLHCEVTWPKINRFCALLAQFGQIFLCGVREYRYLPKSEFYFVLDICPASAYLCSTVNHMEYHWFRLRGFFKLYYMYIYRPTHWKPVESTLFKQSSIWEPEGCYCCTTSIVIAPFWFSMDRRWMALTAFWFSANNIWRAYFQKGLDPFSWLRRKTRVSVRVCTCVYGKLNIKFTISSFC